MSWGYERDDRRNAWLKVISTTEALFRLDEDKFVERMEISDAKTLEQATLRAIHKATRRCIDACPYKYYQIRAVRNPYLAGTKLPKSSYLAGLLTDARYRLDDDGDYSTVIFLPAKPTEVAHALANRKLVDWEDNSW